MILNCIFLILCVFVLGGDEPETFNQLTHYGLIFNNLPTIKERKTHHFVNMARISPQEYVSNYAELTSEFPLEAAGVLEVANYVSVRPLWLEYKTSLSARYHCSDLFLNCPEILKHDSCNGETEEFRFTSFTDCTDYVGELGSRGYIPGVTTVNGILCEKFICSQDNCCPDNNQDTHRKMLMKNNSQIVGVGYYDVWHFIVFGGVCNVEEGSTFKIATHPIFSGIHSNNDSTGTIKFMSVFFNDEISSLDEAKLWLNGSEYDLQLEFGTILNGHYVYETDRVDQGCREYHFQFFKSGYTKWRFPQHGNYYTTGENEGCTLVYTNVDISEDDNILGKVFSIIGIVIGSIFGIICFMICTVVVFVILIMCLTAITKKAAASTDKEGVQELRDNPTDNRPEVPEKGRVSHYKRLWNSFLGK